MIQGLWIVQYEGIQGNGGGAAVFVNGKVLGGDTGYTYIGTYTEKDGKVIAHVRVGNFLPGIPNVLGVVGDFDLDINGQMASNVIKGVGSVAGRPGASVNLKLTKKADL
jgi:hypothetical protein